MEDSHADSKRADKWAFLLIAIFLATMLILGLALPTAGGLFR